MKLTFPLNLNLTIYIIIINNNVRTFWFLISKVNDVFFIFIFITRNNNFY